MPSPATHIRAPLFWLLVPLCTGLVAARLWPVPAYGLGPLAVMATIITVGSVLCACRPGRLAGCAWAISLFVATGLGGFVLLHARHPSPPEEKLRPPREIAATIEIRQPFAVAPSSRQFTGVARVIAAGASDDTLVGRLVYYGAVRRVSLQPQRTGRYVIRGVLEPLPSGPAADGFTDYLANLGVTHRITRAHVVREIAPPTALATLCIRIQGRLTQILRHGLDSQPQAASLYLAILVGEKAVLTADQENAYMRSGTFHIFSISGLHVGVIATGLILVGKFLRVPRRRATVAILALLWVYVQVTGASSPAVRAFLMVAAFGISRAFQLPGNPLAALAMAALATLLLDPLQLFSTGFQMSYTVVIALIAMGRPLGEKWLAAWKPFALLPRTDWRRWHHWIEALGRYLIMALAGCWTAFLASTPSGIGYFQLFSPGSLPANLLIIPLSNLVIYTGFASLIAGLFGLLPVSAACNFLAAWTIVVMDWLLIHGTAFPAMWFTATYRITWMAPVAMIFMTAVFLTGAAVRWSPRYGGYWPPAIALALLIIFGVKFD